MKENNQTTNQSARKPRYYLAYGSNLNKSRIEERCPTSKRVGTGVIEGYELMFRRSCTGYYLSIDPKEGGIVPVGVYEVQPSDEATLDEKEGYPTWYGKKTFQIRLEETGEEIEGFAYLLPLTAPKGQPTLEYVKIVRKGYREFGFDIRILNHALSLVC